MNRTGFVVLLLLPPQQDVATEWQRPLRRMSKIQCNLFVILETKTCPQGG